MAVAEFIPNDLGELSRTLALIDAADANIRRRFLELIGRAKGVLTLEEIEGLIAVGRMNEALILIESVGPGLNQAITAAYVAAGVSVAETLRSASGLQLIEFDSLNTRGVFALQQSQARLVRELASQQAQALAVTLQNGIRAGLTPRQIAASVRGSIGLTGAQAQAVSNYRNLLTNLSSEALRRELRDKRFDSTVRRAIKNSEPLSAAQIDRMVERYEQRSLTHRAQVIGSTEALSAVNMGEAEMWAQGVDQGLDPNNIEQTWHPRFINTRDSHAEMDGQTRPLGVAFLSGNGIALRFPGDSSAPAREVASCHCVISRRFLASPL